MTRFLGRLGVYLIVFGIILFAVKALGLDTISVSIPVAKDSYVSDGFSAKTHNMGASLSIKCGYDDSGRNSALIEFDLSEIQDNTVVKEAIMTLHAVECKGGDKQFGVYRLLKSWAEGNGAGSSADGSECCGRWSGTGWAWGCDAAREPGEDFESHPDDVVLIGDASRPYQFDITGITQHWLCNPEENFGVTLQEILTGQDAVGAKIFVSREHPDVSFRPKLEVILACSVDTGDKLSTKWGAIKFWRTTRWGRIKAD